MYIRCNGAPLEIIMATKIPTIPATRDLIAHTLKSVMGPYKVWIVRFEYPDCYREFDGREWRVTPKQLAS